MFLRAGLSSRSKECSKHTNPQGPCARQRLATRGALSIVERVFQHCIMQRPEDQRPGHERGSSGIHQQFMTKRRPPFRRGEDFEGVRPVKSPWCRETKPDESSRLIGFDRVADRSMPVHRALLQRAIKPHRRPVMRGPDGIGGRGQTIQERTEPGAGHRFVAPSIYFSAPPSGARRAPG